MIDDIRSEAQAFLAAWFETRRVVQSLNFNRFQQEGLSATQFIMLNMLGEGAPGQSPADLARKLNVDVTTSMRTADSLVARGLLSKTRDPVDGRRSVLALTEPGRAIFSRMHEAFVAQVQAAFEAMPPALRAGLVTGLQAFVAETTRRQNTPS